MRTSSDGLVVRSLLRCLPVEATWSGSVLSPEDCVCNDSFKDCNASPKLIARFPLGSGEVNLFRITLSLYLIPGELPMESELDALS
jgi:hypothetical protein